MKRYGLAGGASERKWERFDKRFDLVAEPNEVNRFGYVVEVDPWDPSSTPVKHTALGRFKHEAATIYITSDGTVVAYSGDDERFDYMYKFVSSQKMQDGKSQAAMRHNMTLLDAGTLYVAKLSGNSAGEIDGTGKLPSDGKFDGTGEWVAILRTGEDGKGESLVDGMSAEEVAVFTRQAGDKVGATKMDRPEDFEANPKSGKVYVALTNNTKRGVDGGAAADEANPGTTTRTVRSSKSPTITPAPPSAGIFFSSAEIRLQLIPTSVDSTRARSARSRARTTLLSTHTATCGSRRTVMH